MDTTSVSRALLPSAIQAWGEGGRGASCGGTAGVGGWCSVWRRGWEVGQGSKGEG